MYFWCCCYSYQVISALLKLWHHPYIFFSIPFSPVFYDRVFSTQYVINADLAVSLIWKTFFHRLHLYILRKCHFAWFFTTCYICAMLYYATVLMLASLLICGYSYLASIGHYAYIPILPGRLSHEDDRLCIDI